MANLPTIRDVEAAAECLAGLAVVTPLIEHPALNDAVGGRVLLKAENLQRVGAFKFRGAYNAISRVDRSAHPGGVVACSSGNHAQGVAHAATLCGLKSVVVMPADSPRLKIARTREFGAEVVTYDRVTEDREAIARRICAERGAAFIHPFDDPLVIAGQGTAGLELMRQAKALGAVPEAVAICCSGGGFASGVALAVKSVAASAEIFTVEPAGFDDMARSLVSGQQETNARASGSICDALMATSPGVNTLAILRATGARGLSVTDDEARQAMRFAFRELKLVVEPGGAVALAAVLTGRMAARGRTVAVVLSGGNVDPALYGEIITG
ncbi:MAG: threonine/serine dehydratase [Hyphomicrobiaceae bacterium]